VERVTGSGDGGSGGSSAAGGNGGAIGGGGNHGGAGVSGTAGSGVGGGTSGAAGGAAGSPGRPLGAGCSTDDQCTSNICDSATSMCCSGQADICNTCIGGYLTPKKDGTSCGGGLCDGVAPYVGERSCTATNYVCMNGVCSTTTVNCCVQNGCTTGQAACTGVAEDHTQPTMCIAGCE
jgi:hypothetical protein